MRSQGRHRQPHGRDGADRRRPAAPGPDRQAAAGGRRRPRQEPIPRRAIRRATMPSATPAAARSLKLIEAKKPKPVAGAEPQRRFNFLAQRRIDLRRQAPRGTARETQQLGLAAGRRQRPVQCVAHDRGIVAVGDDQARGSGKIALMLEQCGKIRRHRPEEMIAIIEIVGPLGIIDQVGLGDLDLDDGQRRPWGRSPSCRRAGRWAAALRRSRTSRAGRTAG